MKQNLYGNMYGSSNRKPRGNGAKRSVNGNLEIGNGNLTPRKRIRKAVKPMPRRKGVAGVFNVLFGGGINKEIDWSGKVKGKKQCFCTPPAGYEDLGGTQSIMCHRFRKCSNCCQSRFGANWDGYDAIQGMNPRR